MIVFQYPLTPEWMAFLKSRAIEKIKAQPFFSPRIPHRLDGMPLSADEIAEIRERGTDGLAIQIHRPDAAVNLASEPAEQDHKIWRDIRDRKSRRMAAMVDRVSCVKRESPDLPPLEFSRVPFRLAVDEWAAQFKGADFGEPGGDKTAVVEGTRFKDGAVRIDRITEHDSYAAAPSPVPGLEMFGIPLQESRCQCRQCLRDRNEGVSMGGVLWPIEATRMILCPKCGNKRCPHATDHRNACTGSNEPGQPGSAYGPEIPKPGVWFDEAWELDE